MGMGEALGAVFAGAAGEYSGNRAEELRSQEKMRLEQAREEKLMAIKNRYDVENREDQQLYGTSEREAGQTYQAGENQKNRDLTTSEGAANRALTASEGAANRSQRAALAKMEQDGKLATAGGTDAEGNPAFDKQWTRNSEGQWGRVDVYANGRQKWVPAPASTVQTLDNREAAMVGAGKPGPYEQALDILAANPEAVTGKMRSLANTTEAGKSFMDAKDILWSSPEEKKVQQALKLVNGYRRLQGVGQAKELGASGINTAQEAKDYMTAIPELDTSSTEAFVESLKAQRNFIQGNKIKEGMKLGVPREEFGYIIETETAPAAPASSGGGYGSKYGY